MNLVHLLELWSLLFSIFLTGGGDWQWFSHSSGGTKIIRWQYHFLLLFISAPVPPDKMLVSSGTINPPFWIKSLHLLLKLILGFTDARKWFSSLLNLFFSSLVNLWLPFIVFIAHSTMAFSKSLLAGASDARLACGLVSLRTWRKCSCDFSRFIPLSRRKDLS